MNQSPLKLLHVSPWVRTIGGVETLLAHHAREDPGHGFEAWQMALFDKTAVRPSEHYSTQAFSWKSTPHTMRRVMARTLADHAGSVVVWHNAWGVPWFADVDASTRRIICLQDSVTHFGSLLPGLTGMVDGVTCLSESAARSVLDQWPGFPRERLAVMPLPIAPPAELSAVRALRREWIIGCAGRLVRAQKRWDRLVPFVKELRRLGLPCRLEVVGDGPLRQWLKWRLRHDSAIQFLGWQNPADYWRRLQTWDVSVSFTDHEGGPIVLLETMAAGVIPLYPAIGGSLGDDYAAQVDPRCYYPAGDPRAAARSLRELLASPPEQIARMRQRAQELAQPHATPGTYTTAFAGFIRRIAALPRVSSVPDGRRRPQVTDLLPLGLLTRALPGALRR